MKRFKSLYALFKNKYLEDWYLYKTQLLWAL
jgi:hypothetical protein